MEYPLCVRTHVQQMLFSEELAIGMEDVSVGDEVDDQDEEIGDMAEKDDTDLCFQKHTGKLVLCSVSAIKSGP